MSIYFLNFFIKIRRQCTRHRRQYCSHRTRQPSDRRRHCCRRVRRQTYRSQSRTVRPCPRHWWRRDAVVALCDALFAPLFVFVFDPNGKENIYFIFFKKKTL